VGAGSRLDDRFTSGPDSLPAGLSDVSVGDRCRRRTIVTVMIPRACWHFQVPEASLVFWRGQPVLSFRTNMQGRIFRREITAFDRPTDSVAARRFRRD